ncbi:bifunctional transcriptional activator/DNA repair enzyme AdaA [Geosporobacter ferrireducens]|uniref:bifunctional transcriptional activator/DNA repair enzyme AdaA n=1 Tax=Geosporobacter ferrireducens TaxID=1424294 RepID=UPI00139B034C|nr:Ada metal-binding domain-containing protein [Geosporobacter ferrireducens]MTI58183.1 methylphosphotriester-DNA--protein-cysteine methyltransferase family protein [Geosporobacter ferrireducens]
MKDSKEISENEKWQAVISCIDSYDGLFFYGVKTTGIFCRPSCRAKPPIRENTVFFDRPAAAIKAGFRPCKKCRPDQVVFQPDLDLVKKAKEFLDTNYNQSIDSKYIIKELGVSINHLARLFKQHTGFTITEYLAKVRVDKAIELIELSDEKIIDIAYMTGFKSLSNFYKCFKALTRCTPNAYKKGRGD